MTSTAWTFPIPADRVAEFRSLLTELNEKHLEGLAWDTTTTAVHAQEGRS